MIRIMQLSGAFFLLIVGAIAGPPPITITDAGYFVTQVDESGYPSIVKVETVIDLRTGSTPETPKKDPPAEPTPPPEGISADAAAWADDVGDPQAAQKYALVFETTRDGVADGLVTEDSLFRVLKESANQILDSKWDAFRRRLGDHLTEQLQAGQLNTTRQIADQLEMIRYGLAFSARDSKAIPPSEVLTVVSKVNSVIRGGN